MLSPRLVKESASVIAKPITNILNTSIEQGCYPNAWKMGQATPLFQKDDESNKANYRPVTVLPVLNNIYERQEKRTAFFKVERLIIDGSLYRGLETSAFPFYGHLMDV